MSYAFGNSISYTLYAMVDDDMQYLPSAPEAIYIYADKPSLSTARSGLGTIVETISSWSTASDGYGKSFTIAAIDDPDPTGSTDRRTYWLAANFKFQTGEQAQTIIRALPMQRPTGWHKVISTAIADLEAIFPNIDAYCGDTAQTNAITNAKTKIELEFEARGFEWALVWEADRLGLACAYRALSDLLFSLKNPDFVEMAAKYLAQAENLIQIIKLEYDSDDAGEPEVTAMPQTFQRIIR